MSGRRLRVHPTKNQLAKMYLSENGPQGNQKPFHSHSNSTLASNSNPPTQSAVAMAGQSTDAPASVEQSAAKPKFLSPADERSLVWRWQKRKDHRARDALMRAFQPAIISFAEKYRGRGLDLKDRISLGNIGFLVALDKFNIKLRWRLWTYAKHWVRAEIGSATEKSRSIVVRPRGARGEKAKRNNLSLNTPVREGGANDIDDYPDHEPRHFNNQALIDALELLKPRERAIFTARRLSDEPEPRTTLAAQFQISSERVRQIENDALAIVSARMKEAETRLSPQFARQLTAETFRGRGHKLSYSYCRWPDFRDRPPCGAS
jgi:RNA polymerase sigma factor (sigma-70 family)